jgi:hypothetical protein
LDLLIRNGLVMAVGVTVTIAESRSPSLSATTNADPTLRPVTLPAADTATTSSFVVDQCAFLTPISFPAESNATAVMYCDLPIASSADDGPTSIAATRGLIAEHEAYTQTAAAMMTATI